MTLPNNVIVVRSAIVQFFVLRDAADDALYLIDTGFLRGPALLQKALTARGWQHLPIRGILHTHGHLDHTLNTVEFAKRDAAWIAGTHADAAGFAGTARYSGLARVTNVLQAVGGKLFRYAPFTPDRWLEPGEILNICGGLRVVPLPGHTPGHVGFFSLRDRLLFSGDLFNSYSGLVIRPPAIFNANPGRIPQSIAAALTLPLDGVLPNHGDSASPQLHLARLQRLDARPFPNHTPVTPP